MTAVISKDGTKIAYERRGKGSAVILVEGAMGFRALSGLGLAELLAPHFTVYSYDRRGRGESTDTLPFAVQREVEDIEALIHVAGGSAYIYGISSGAALALEAAIVLKDEIKKLAIYEAPYDSSESGLKVWKEYRVGLAEALGNNRRGDAIVLFMKLVGVSDEMIDGMRRSPMWSVLASVAPTLEYDARALGEDRRPPVDRVTDITAQTLVMDGGASLAIMPFMRATAEVLTKAIPGAQHKVLEGQQHNVDMKVLAPVLVKFFSGRK
jgi:pimeloyl-ACP methyl ester carboxylesterase